MSPPSTATGTTVASVGLNTIGRALIGPQSFYNVVAGTALGASVWVTFIAGPIQYYNLPRAIFGNLQSKQFPAFFALQTITSSMMLLSYLVCTPHRIAFKIPGSLRNPIVFNAWLLAAMVASSLANLGYAGPVATSIMQDRHRLEKLEGTTYDAPGEKSPRMLALNKSFAWAHSVSSLLNVGYLGAAVLHVSWMAKFGTC